MAISTHAQYKMGWKYLFLFLHMRSRKLARNCQSRGLFAKTSHPERRVQYKTEWIWYPNNNSL